MKKILVIDDEPDILLVIKVRLSARGYTIFYAANGKEGLEVVKTESPDLIICDVLMPVMDGFAFYKELKKNPATVDIPVLILTARGRMEDSFRVVGVDDFLDKNFEPKELVAKVEQLLTRTRAESPKRILIAGSDREVIENMVMQLKRKDCRTSFALTGAEVFSKTVKGIPDILILDVAMDDISSHEIINMLRRIPQFERIPILTYSFYRLSDLGSEDVRQRALSIDLAQKQCQEAGATAFMGRFNEHNFLKIVTPYL